MENFNIETAMQAMSDALPPCVQTLGLRIETMGSGEVSMLMSPGQQGIREGGTVSGQALASLADTAMLVALWSSLGTAKPVATVTLHVTYLRPASAGDVVARARIIRRGRGLAFAHVDMASAASPTQAVATAVATFALPQ